MMRTIDKAREAAGASLRGFAKAARRLQLRHRGSAARARCLRVGIGRVAWIVDVRVEALKSARDKTQGARVRSPVSKRFRFSGTHPIDATIPYVTHSVFHRGCYTDSTLFRT